MLPDGTLDDMSLHAGCNVESNDIKWSANKWLWNKPTRGLWMGDDVDMRLQSLADNKPGDIIDRKTEDLVASALGEITGESGGSDSGSGRIFGLMVWAGSWRLRVGLAAAVMIGLLFKLTAVPFHM
jgi:hypothetical protein